MARINTKIGDIFSVKIDDKSKKYLQYIASDLTQLNSDVIRVFKESYPINSNPDLVEMVKGEIQFYAHCVTKWGIKLGYWEKIGNVVDLGNIPHILFRGTRDSGNPEIQLSSSWYIWSIGEPFKYVGNLVGDYQNAEIGSVIPPDSIVHRMKTGEYDFIYPGYE